MRESKGQVRQWPTLGTHFALTVWDDISKERFDALAEDAVQRTNDFDRLYSRFRADSLITRLSKTTGTIEVPRDLTAMLRLYETLFYATKGKITPTIGFTLSDTGYDAEYSFAAKDTRRGTPPLPEAVTIQDETHITLHTEVLLDLGALGKGYLVDLLFRDLRAEGLGHYLVDGSGDVRYAGQEPITCGLEHPKDSTMAIGTLRLSRGALCASATNRRRWGDRHHYIDPATGESPQEIIATWVRADTAALADGLSSALFFTNPADLLESGFMFDYLVVNKDLKMKISAGFEADADIFY